MSNWPFYTEGTAISTNQEMIHELLKRKNINISTEDTDKMKVLGDKFEERRYAHRLTRSEICHMTGLSTGFLCILETGNLLPSDITDEVLEALPCLKDLLDSK
tara:strand:+ start:219 stop:527 length:309 start_codon:yes stop_codon:yes gene_type:complete